MNQSVEQLKRLPSRVTRELLRIPIVKSLTAYSYQKQLEGYHAFLPYLSSPEKNLVESLEARGTFVTSLNDLNFVDNVELIESIHQLKSQLEKLPTNEKNVVALPTEIMMNYPAIFLWGLQEKLLDIVENYLGVPLRYHGPGMRREIADGKATDVRQWHIDPEDRRMVKIIIYLNEVNIDGGPYEYISLPLTSLCTKALKYSSGYVSDRAMQEVLPVDYWQPCLGNFGTAIFSDTCRVLHRAKPPLAVDRYSLSFTYTSKKPLAYRYDQFHFSLDYWLKMRSRLSERQRDAILYTTK